jgi:hypothetical protein
MLRKWIFINMPNDFKLTADFKQFDKFINFTRLQAIGIVKRSMRKTVNSQAWITRKFAQKKEIPNSMTTRGTFNQRTIRVRPAKGRSLTSEVGNIELGGYKGLTNLELGRTQENKAIPHIKEVRSGSKKKKIPRSKHMKSVKAKFRRIHKASDLRKLSNSGFKGYFEMRGGRPTELWPGIYRFTTIQGKNKFGKRRRLEYIRDTSHPRAKAQLNKWLGRSTKKATSQGITNREWQRAMDIEINKIKKLFK